MNLHANKLHEPQEADGTDERFIVLGQNKAGDFYLSDTLYNGEECILPLSTAKQRYQPKRTL